MPALEDPPVMIGSGPRPDRLFDPGGRTLEDRLRETDDALATAAGRACLVCGAMTVGGDLEHAGRVHRLRQPAGIAPAPAARSSPRPVARECPRMRPPRPSPRGAGCGSRHAPARPRCSRWTARSSPSRCPRSGEELGADSHELSYVLTAYFVAYGLMLFPGGALVDRIGSRTVGLDGPRGVRRGRR